MEATGNGARAEYGGSARAPPHARMLRVQLLVGFMLGVGVTLLAWWAWDRARS